METKKKGYAPDKIQDMEAVCQVLEDIQNRDQRLNLASVATAYINGIKQGIALSNENIDIDDQ